MSAESLFPERSRIDNLLHRELAALPEKPGDESTAPEKKRYSELLSNAVAQAFAEELRARGCDGALPGPPTENGRSGAERRMSGGIGAKKVDVTWATEESGLILGISVKSINFRDGKTGNFQKNLINRRGDMLIEAVTLHRRFPYAVLAGFFFLDAGAAEDGTDKRRSTFENARARFGLFTGRDDPAGRDEQYERMYLVLLDSTAQPPSARVFGVGREGAEVGFQTAFEELVSLVAERNPDFYEDEGGDIRRVSG